VIDWAIPYVIFRNTVAGSKATSAAKAAKLFSLLITGLEGLHPSKPKPGLPGAPAWATQSRATAKVKMI
jgi:hypothetical protein